MKALGDKRGGEAAMRVAHEQGSSSQVEKCPKCVECPECGRDPNYHYLVNQDLPNVLASKISHPEIDKIFNMLFFQTTLLHL